MDRGGPRAKRANAQRRPLAGQAPSRSSGVGFLRIRGNTKQAQWTLATLNPDLETI
jgi:hypothetical protein